MVTYLGGSGNAGPGLGVQLCDEGREVFAREGPLKGSGDLFVAMLESQQAMLHFGERREVIGSEHLSLHDGEVDLDLIQPTGMQGRVHQDDGRPPRAKPVGCLLTAVCRAVVHDPKDPARRSVRLLLHHLAHQAVHWSDSVFGLTATKQFGTMDVPSSQVGPRPGAAVFVFDLHRATRKGRQRGMPTATSLDTGFLVGAEDEIGGVQRLAVPAPLVQVQDGPSFFQELRIAGKDPTPVAPGAKSVRAEPPPQGGPTDVGHDALGENLALDFRDREPRKRQAQAVGQFTGESFDLYDDAGGKSGRAARRGVAPANRAAVPARNACATC